MSKRKSLLERVNSNFFHQLKKYPGLGITTDAIVRLIRAEQKRKCRECLDQKVKNIEAREGERLLNKNQ